MSPHDPEDREQLLRQPQAGDTVPVPIPRVRLSKCVAITDAVALGHELWREPALDVGMYLTAAAGEAVLGADVLRVSAEELWADRVEPLPWPPAGPPAPQAD